jgi:hypothetical protein
MPQQEIDSADLRELPNAWIEESLGNLEAIRIREYPLLA